MMEKVYSFVQTLSVNHLKTLGSQRKMESPNRNTSYGEPFPSNKHLSLVLRRNLL